MNPHSEQQRQGIGMTSRRTRERLAERLRAQGITREDVLDAIMETPRHLFVEDALSHRAYEDTALPIGNGQTISQPYIVARMTELLLSSGAPGSVLEIGTGCGYQTAVLARLVPQVYSVERILALHQQAAQLLNNLGIYNVNLKYADGNDGWPNPSYRFDRIIMTAAGNEVPQKLLEQLTDNGELVMPLSFDGVQYLTRISRKSQQFVQQRYEAVSFVPFLPGLE